MRASARRNDFVVGIGTPGNSHNVIEAMKKAREIGAFTLGLTGKDGGRLKNVADQCINVKSNLTPIIQEMHIVIIHMICYSLDAKPE